MTSYNIQYNYEIGWYRSTGGNFHISKCLWLVSFLFIFALSIIGSDLVAIILTLIRLQKWVGLHTLFCHLVFALGRAKLSPPRPLAFVGQTKIHILPIPQV